MFEITNQDGELLKEWIAQKKVYAGAVYDFTFENRFMIYHCNLVKKTVYIAADKTTGYGSEVVRRDLNDLYTPSEYQTMIYPILRSVKYTGDSRHLGTAYICPTALIDVIFREILPRCGYSAREEQISLCKEMYKGLNEKKVSLCEAEVGTGKTFAYLVASFLANQRWSTQYGIHFPVTVTTSSLELQHALLKKDIPALSSALLRFGILKKPLTAVLRKGKEHYFCRFRYEDYKKQITQFPLKFAGVIHLTDAFDVSKEGVDLDGANLPLSIKSRICVKGSCYKCKYESDCLYKAFLHLIARNYHFDFQITNHNLYQTYMKQQAKNKSALLSPSQYIIVDEAHKFRETAQSIFGTAFSENDVPKYLNYAKNLYTAKTNLGQYKRFLQDTARLNQTLFEKMKAVYPLNPDEDETSRMIKLCGEDISLISRLIHSIENIERRKRTRTGSVEIRAKSLIEALQMLLNGKNNIWIETNGNEVLSLCSAPKKISDVLSRTVWKNDVSHVLTSGTMSDGMDFDFFRRENGLDQLTEHQILTTARASPFDYENHTRLYIPTGMPQPDNDDPVYIQAVADQIVRLVRATNGHTAILFTSYKLLSAIYELTKDQLPDGQLICMTRSNKNAIKEFQKSRNSVLFASGAFWEGVDCVGDRLSSVIIVRLPFPMRSAHLEQMKNSRPDVRTFIQTYAVPEMLIKLRQGVGRLIRCESDTGLISILDARAEKGIYAEKIRQVLRKYPEVQTIEEVQAFFKAVKPKEYFEDRVDV